jgi:ribosome-associated heat shock protein Hsp15
MVEMHVRVDRWLWAARLFKTRGAATEAAVGGRVHVNGTRVKPAKEIRAGDRLDVTVGGARRELVVLAVAEKRGPASVAATLYEETPESLARRERLAVERRVARPLGADLGARPTKRDRRRLDALRAQLRSRRP